MKNEIYSSQTEDKIAYTIEQVISPASEDWIAQHVGGEQKAAVSYDAIIDVDGQEVRIGFALNPTKALYKSAEDAIARYFAE